MFSSAEPRSQAPLVLTALFLVLAVAGCDEPARPWSARPHGSVVDESRPFLPSSGESGWLGDAGLDELLEEEDAGSGAPEPSPESAPASRVGGLWAACYRGFTTTNGPARDVTRLGLGCGPVNGMKQLGKTVSGALDPETPVRHLIEAQQGGCYRVFVATAGVDSFAVTVSTSRGTPVAAAEVPTDGDERAGEGGGGVARRRGQGAFAVVDPERPFCTFEPATFVVQLSAPSAGGFYALQVWQLSPSKSR